MNQIFISAWCIPLIISFNKQTAIFYENIYICSISCWPQNIFWKQNQMHPASIFQFNRNYIKESHFIQSRSFLVHPEGDNLSISYKTKHGLVWVLCKYYSIRAIRVETQGHMSSQTNSRAENINMRWKYLIFSPTVSQFGSR